MKTQGFRRYLKSLSKAAYATVPVVIAGMMMASPKASASGADDYCFDVACTSFFTPELIDRPMEVPFFRSGHTFYQGDNYDYGNDATKRIDTIATMNLKEWSKALNGQMKDSTLSYLIYKMPIAELDQVIWTLEGKKLQSMPQTAIDTVNELKKTGNSARNLEMLYYIGFAKRVEPLATRRINQGEWEEPAQTTPADIQAAEKLIAGGLKQSALVKDQFLKERYKLQIIRLMYYADKFSDAQKYFAANIDSFKLGGSAKSRFIDAAAGAFYKDKKYAMANYLFSINFDTFAPMKKSSYFSFHPQEQSDWLQTLALAKNQHQTNVLWQMFGIYADGVVAIKKIYAADAKSDLLPLLLVREVNKAEEDLVSNEAYNASGVDTSTRGSDQLRTVLGQERMKTIKAIADAGNTVKPYLWDLGAAHLEALLGNKAETNALLARAAQRGMPTASKFVEQVRMTKLLAEVQALKSVDSTIEDYLGTEIAWMVDHKYETRLDNLKTWTLDKLSSIYMKQGDLVKALMLKDNNTNAAYGSPQQIDMILAVMKKPVKTKFEAALVKNYPYTVADLEEVKAINQVYQGQFVLALPAFEAKQGQDDQVLAADPFTSRLNDCHDCDFETPHSTYTKADFVKKMIELQAVANGNGPKAADASFAFANGLYNMSYYGNGRRLYDTKNSNFYNSKKVLSNKAAMGYYERAMKLATNKETQAKAAFMAAKAEKNEFYNTQKQKDNWYFDEDGAPHSPKFFGILKAQFSDTQYYQEIIQECGTFRRYLKQNP